MKNSFPVLFLSHGAPNILLHRDPLLDEWRQQLRGISKPDAVLVVSAHWVTNKVTVGGNHNQRTIHDFYGFPDELYDYQYPAVSGCDLAEELAERCGLQLDHERGLDHGAWVPLVALFPRADIPVAHMSVSPRMDCESHYQLGHDLAYLRRKNILIIASGVIVHNLRALDWRNPSADPEPWAMDFMGAFQHAIDANDLAALCHPLDLPNGNMAMPTLEHYLPFMVALGAAVGDRPHRICDEWRYANLGMHGYRFAS
ncbi:MAG: class III extradiol ring-cleavage dioxygenase [Sedimenticola sp.]